MAQPISRHTDVSALAGALTGAIARDAIAGAIARGTLARGALACSALAALAGCSADPVGSSLASPSEVATLGRGSAGLDGGAPASVTSAVRSGSIGIDGRMTGSDPARTDASLAARQISSSADLIGGLRADGRAGDYLLANDRIRVIIQDIDHGAQFYIFGGNIIDADVVRASGDPGKDLLAEFFVDVNLTHTILPYKIEVLKDGSDGQEARIRVSGSDFPWPILPGKDPVEPMPLVFTQDYILHPGERYVTIETTAKNTGPKPVNVLEAELLLVGSSLSMSAQGIEPGNIVGRTEYIAMKGSQTVGASYAYLPEKGSMIIPFEDAAQTGAILENARARPGGSVTWRRLFVVGDRDAASVTDAIFALRGTKTGTLTGMAVDPAGAPVGDATIVVVDAGGKYVTQCLSRADGSFSAALPPGDVTLRVSAAGRVDQTSSPYTVTAGQTTSASLTLTAQGRLAFRAVDESGQACPVRATIRRADGQTTYVPSYRGGETVSVPPGDYTVALSRGLEYDVAVHTVTVPSSGAVVNVPSSGAAVLARVIDSPGWISGDFHLHQKNSNDSWTLLETRVTSLLAEGVEVGVPTDHDHVSDLGPTLTQLGLTGKLVTAPGNEVSIVDYGHFNYYPVVDPDDSSLQGTQYWFDEALTPLSASELFAKMRENPTDTVVQINHPRDGASGYFTMIGYNTDTGRGIREPLATDFDAIEVKTDVFGDESVLPDYFSLLNQGLRVTAMGNSDAHRGLAENGYPRTYMRVPDDRTQATSIQQVVSAIKGGHAVVSGGIFIDLKAAVGSTSAGPGDTLVSAGSPVTVTVRLQCPAWTSMSRFVLYANGQAVPLAVDGNGYVQDPGGATELALAPVLKGGRYEQTLSISVAPSRDTHYVLMAWGEGSLGWVDGDTPLGYTSPVFVDFDGSGFTAAGSTVTLSPAPRGPALRLPSTDECGDESADEAAAH